MAQFLVNPTMWTPRLELLPQTMPVMRDQKRMPRTQMPPCATSDQTPQEWLQELTRRQQSSLEVISNCAPLHLDTALIPYQQPANLHLPEPGV